MLVAPVEVDVEVEVELDDQVLSLQGKVNDEVDAVVVVEVVEVVEVVDDGSSHDSHPHSHGPATLMKETTSN